MANEPARAEGAGEESLRSHERSVGWEKEKRAMGTSASWLPLTARVKARRKRGNLLLPTMIITIHRERDRLVRPQ